MRMEVLSVRLCVSEDGGGECDGAVRECESEFHFLPPSSHSALLMDVVVTVVTILLNGLRMVKKTYSSDYQLTLMVGLLLVYLETML